MERGEDEVCEIFLFKGKYYEFHVQIDWNRYDKQYYYIDYYRLVDVQEIELDCIQKGSVETLWEIFGGTINKKGYKVLDEHVGLIYGDSITPDRADEILDKLEKKGFASNNIIFGIGSYTFNFSTRDTLGFAMKATYGEINGKGIEIFKDPKTDSGKKSAKGLLKVIKDSEGEYLLLDQQSDDNGGELNTIFEDGEFMNLSTFDEIRERINQW